MYLNQTHQKIAFEQSDWYFRAGKFSEALLALETGKIETQNLDSDGWSAKKIARQARIALRLGDDYGARQRLLLISENRRKQDASLDALCLAIEGFLDRHMAIAARQRQEFALAGKFISQAIRKFQNAATAAEFDDDLVQVINNHQNVIYAKGFLAALQSRSVDANPELLVAGIFLEFELIGKTPPDDRSRFPGLTMLADLAWGAKLSLARTFSLRGKDFFQKPGKTYGQACAQIFGTHTAAEWAEQILFVLEQEINYGGVQSSSLLPWHHAQAVIFGSKIVAKTLEIKESKTLALKYMLNLEYALHLYETMPALSREILTAQKKLAVASNTHWRGQRELR